GGRNLAVNLENANEYPFSSPVFKMLAYRITLLSTILLGVGALHINKIKAPEHAVIGDTVTLTCDYDLEGGKLYLVKWYHDNVEFYWYRASDGSWAFPEKDMTVDLSTSDERQVTLQNVSKSLSGKYICEVSLDEPQYTSHRATHQLTISKGTGSRIKDLKLMLPQVVQAGDAFAVLECMYEVVGVHLDSIKWYKDLTHFYTFQPGHPPIKESRPLPGIRVDLPSSNDKQVALYNINVDTAGSYKCEVTTDTQPQESLSAEGKLTVFNPKFPELQIPIVSLPADVYIGDRTATLQCNYDLKGEKLYLMRWYKDNQEIYQFRPDSTPQQNVFSHQPVNIDKIASDSKQLVITNITQDSAGLYHCQVETDAPSLKSLKSKQVQLNIQDSAGSRTLQKPKLLVPETVRVGNKLITLKCDYNLHGERLYSVQWFKNSIEIFRFMPSSTPQKIALPIPGINID
ncbi:hypothetical protein L9F63_006966, partial [Diploptera punctata]